MAMQAYLCERIFRASEMVDQCKQLAYRILACCSLENRLARVVLRNNILPVKLPAPVGRQQDLTTLAVGKQRR